jgi:hypothetical protein
MQVVEDEAVKKGGRFRSRASIVATGEEAKRIAEAANRPMTPASAIPEGTMTRLLYEGDFQISGLQCMVGCSSRFVCSHNHTSRVDWLG